MVVSEEPIVRVACTTATETNTEGLQDLWVLRPPKDWVVRQSLLTDQFKDWLAYSARSHLTKWGIVHQRFYCSTCV